MIQPKDMIAICRQAIAEKWGYIWGKMHEMWTETKQKAYEKAYSDDPDRGSSAKYGGKWVGHWVTDCSGLITYIFQQLGGKMYHGSDTMFRKWCADKGELKGGKRTDGHGLKPGTAVFCYNASRGKYSHVGLYCGDGIVIEAAGSRQGVIESAVTNSKWKYWGELLGVDYSREAPTPEPTPPGPEPTPGGDKPTLRKGSKGAYVVELQTALIALGYDLGSYGADGNYGKATEAAVKAFQKDRGLVVDGVCGPKTWAALEAAPAPVTVKLYTVTIPHRTREEGEALLKQYPGVMAVEE